MATADATIRIVAEDKTAAAFKKLDSRLDRTTKAFKKFAVGAAAVMGAAGLGRLVGGTINAADQIDKLSTRLGVGTRALSEYKHVADLSGVSFETLTMGMQRMTRRIAEAANGMGEARGALKELNLDAKTLNRLTLDQKFEIIADKLAGLGSESDRVRLAMKLFDSEGVALIQTMEGGAAGIAKMREEARKLGLSLSEDQTEAAARAKDEMSRFMGVLKGIGNFIVLGLLPPLTLVIEVLRDRLVKAIDICVFAWNKLKDAISALIDLVKSSWFKVQIALNNSILFMIDALVKAVDVIAGFQARIGRTFISVDGLKTSLTELKGSISESNAEMQEQIDELERLRIHLDVTAQAMTAAGKKTEASTRHSIRMADAVARAAKNQEDLNIALTDGDKAAMTVARAILAVNEETIKLEGSLTDAEQALKNWGDGVIDAQKESDLLIDKMALLDELFQDGKISGEVYEDALRGLGDAFNDAADDGVALVEVVEDTKTVFEDLVEGIDGSWTDMWKDLFGGGKTEDVLKGFLNRVKKMFLDTLAEIVAAWTKNKIIEIITGGASGGGGSLGSIFTSILGGAGGTTATTGGTTAATSITGGGIGSAISSGFTKIFGSIFGPSTSSGVMTSATTAGSNAATSFMGGWKTALSGAAKVAVPLAIAAFGFGKSRRFNKALRAKFGEVMSDPTIVSNLADGPLAGGFKVLGTVGEQTFAQIGSASAEMFRHFSETSGGVFKDVGGSLGFLSFGLKEMKDEFGNVVVTAENFSGLLEYMKEMEPFSNHAQHLIDTIPAYERAKDSISLIDSELLKAKVQFKNMGEAGQEALRRIDMGSQRVTNIMARGFVTAADFAALGMENLGQISSTMFEKLIGFAQDATGQMQRLAATANSTINTTQRAMDLKAAAGFQHGGSFVVGGGGGTDSQRVSFMATPGERVTVETPNQSKASGSDGGNVVRELRALRHDLASVVAKPIVGAVTRGQLAMAGGARH